MCPAVTIVRRDSPDSMWFRPQTSPQRLATHQVWNRFSRAGKAELEYQPCGTTSWGSRPVLPLQDSRIVIENGSYDVFRDVTNAWQYLVDLRKCESGDTISLKKSRPNKPQEVVDRLLKARESGNPLILFTPWGPRPNQETEHETEALDRIKQVITRIQSMPPTRSTFFGPMISANLPKVYAPAAAPNDCAINKSINPNKLTLL